VEGHGRGESAGPAARGQAPQPPGAVGAAPAPAAEEADKARPPKGWKVSLTATGGELGKTLEKIEIVVNDRSIRATHTRTPEKGKGMKKVVTIPAASAARLWEVMEGLKAWELPDFAKAVLDSPDHTIRLAWGGKSRTIRVKGFSQSDKHRKLILAIHKCFEEGVPK
jgi:hypothetical protein